MITFTGPVNHYNILVTIREVSRRVNLTGSSLSSIVMERTPQGRDL